MASGIEELGSLLQGVSRGDAAAFRRLYDRTSPKLFGVVLRMVRDRAAAHDVLQEAYLRVWQRAGTFDPASGGPMTWLITVARYSAIDALRRSAEPSRRQLQDGDLGLDAVSEVGGYDEDVLARDRLLACLLRLEAEQRRCVLLAYCSGYSRDELAHIVGRPVGTVKTWLRRSLLALRSCLEGE